MASATSAVGAASSGRFHWWPGQAADDDPADERADRAEDEGEERAVGAGRSDLEDRDPDPDEDGDGRDPEQPPGAIDQDRDERRDREARGRDAGVVIARPAVQVGDAEPGADGDDDG